MSSADHHRGTDRIMDIFELLTDTENVGKNLTEIAEALDVPKSSIYPMLRTLTNRGYLHYNQVTSKYYLGYKLYEIGTKYVSEENINDAIYRILQDIVKACEETVILGELSYGDVLYLQKIDLFEKLRLYTVMHRRVPAYAIAMGKALLSEKSKEEIASLYPEGMYSVTSKTITDIDALCEQLEQVRQVGFAFDNEEATKYVRAVAVPIRKNGEIVYALQVAMSVINCTDAKERYIMTLLQDAKRKIEALIKNS